MSVTLQIVGILAVIILFATVLIQPRSILLAVLAVGFIVGAVIVSAHDVDQYWNQREQAALVALQNRQTSAAVAPATMPPPRGS